MLVKHKNEDNLRRLNLISEPVQSEFKLISARACVINPCLILLCMTCLHNNYEHVRVSYNLSSYNLPSFKFRYGNGYQEQQLFEKAYHIQYFSNLTHVFHF